MVGALLGLTIRTNHLSDSELQLLTAKDYPVEAASFVEKRGFPGPLYNHFDWGGYLIWRLPDLPVSIDGRSHIHDAERIRHSIKVWTGQPDWASDTELGAARLVIAQKNLPLTQLLRMDLRFKIVYEDDVAVVFTARD